MYNEQTELPFKERCAIALECLQEFQTKMGDLTTEDLYYLQGKTEHMRAISADMSENAREALAEAGEAGAKLVTEFSQEAARLAWEGAIAALREMLGSDATDFALESMARSARPN